MATKTILNIIKSVVCGDDASGSEREINALKQHGETLYKISKMHDTSHIIGYFLSNNKIAVDKAIYEKFYHDRVVAAFRYERQSQELTRICNALNDARIDYIPLKGAVIRKLYPEPWLRTSCDIDILVHEKDLAGASKAIIKWCGGSVKSKNYHDISIYTKYNVHIELHFSLNENNEARDVVVQNPWEYARKANDAEYRYEFSNEFLVAYAISHSAYHLVSGGCGIKPVLDLWLLRHKLDFDERAVLEILSKGDLTTFYQQFSRLGEVWFGGEAHDTITREMERFIMKGGVYGKMGQGVAVRQAKSGGKVKNLFRRIFLPYKQLKVVYPSLEKLPILYPVYTVIRWFAVLFSGRGKKAMREINTIVKMNDEQKQTAEFLMKELKL